MNPFHKSKKSAAVLKHAVINQYATPFASKTGSTSAGRRVAFIDGYAGPGRYENGDEGSGAMLLRKAHELAQINPPRQVELHFVEQDTQAVASLRQVVSDEGEGVTVTVTDGDISQHLPALLQSTRGIPLFVYLDPCGLVIPLDEVASIFSRPSGPGAPATEILINLSASLRRFAGHLTSDSPVEASLKRMDAVCGGDWWRATWLSHYPNKNASEADKMAAEEAVVAGYAAQLREKAGGAGTWIIDVKPRADLKPLYYLIFATRHIDGLLAFGESASLGLERWRKYHAELAAEGTIFEGAGGWEHEWKAQEAILKAQWVDLLVGRLTAELAKGAPFKVIDKYKEILSNDLVGVVRSLHLRAAMRKLFDDKKSLTNPKGHDDLLNLMLRPA